MKYNNYRMKYEHDNLFFSEVLLISDAAKDETS